MMKSSERASADSVYPLIRRCDPPVDRCGHAGAELGLEPGSVATAVIKPPTTKEAQT